MRGIARRYARTYWVVLAIGAIRELGSGVFIPYWALYLRDSLGASGAQAGALLAVAGGVGLVGAPLGGLLADRIGRRRTLLLALAGVGAGFIAYGSLSSLAAVAVLSPFWGITSDLESPAASAVIADVVDPELRAEAFGLRQQANNIAFALGPPVGALMLLALPLRSVFIFAGVAGLVGFVLAWFQLPETRPAPTAGRPPRFRNALRDRLLLALALGLGVSIIVYSVFDAALGVFLHEDRGYAFSTWGLIFTINPIVIGVTQYPIARWAGRRSPRAILAAGILLQGIAMLIIWPVDAVAIVVLAVLLLTIGEMFLAPVGAALAVSLAPPELRGSYEGVLNLSYAFFWMPGVVGGLALIGAGHGELMLALALPVAVVGALCFLPLPDSPVPAGDVVPVPSEPAPVP